MKIMKIILARDSGLVFECECGSAIVDVDVWLWFLHFPNIIIAKLPQYKKTNSEFWTSYCL